MDLFEKIYAFDNSIWSLHSEDGDNPLLYYKSTVLDSLVDEIQLLEKTQLALIEAIEQLLKNYDGGSIKDAEILLRQIKEKTR